MAAPVVPRFTPKNFSLVVKFIAILLQSFHTIAKIVFVEPETIEAAPRCVYPLSSTCSRHNLRGNPEVSHSLFTANPGSKFPDRKIVRE